MFITTPTKIKKATFFILFFALLLQSACGCMPAHQNVDSHPKFKTKSFVQVFKTVHIEKCKEKSPCQVGDYTSTGSGGVVARGNGYSVILTARHVCETSFVPAVEKIILKKTRTIAIRTWNNQIIPAEVLYLSPHPNIDLCSLKVPDLGVTPIRIAGKPPTVGEKVYSMSAPAGVYHPPAVPILSGFYSGLIEDNINALTSIPAMGGSSGSVVTDQNGRMVGVIYAAVRNFHHITLISGYDETKMFLRASMIELMSGRAARDSRN